MKTILLLSIAYLTGCTYSIAPDGTESFNADPDVFVRAIEILAEK